MIILSIIDPLITKFNVSSIKMELKTKAHNNQNNVWFNCFHFVRQIKAFAVPKNHDFYCPINSFNWLRKNQFLLVYLPINQKMFIFAILSVYAHQGLVFTVRFLLFTVPKCFHLLHNSDCSIARWGEKNQVEFLVCSFFPPTLKQCRANP